MMTTQLADAALFNGRTRRAQAAARVAVAGGKARGDNSWLRAPRGIIFAALLAVPFWAALGASVYYFR